MARPQKNTVDYFPFYCEDGKKMFYIEETYGNDGFATFVKLLRELARTEHHYLDLSKPATMMFLAAKCKVPKEVLNAIINDLCELGKFNYELWNENKIIWCQDFIDSIQDAYSKRSTKCISLQGLYSLLVSLGVRKPQKSTLKDNGNTQSKVKDTKEDKNKEDLREASPKHKLIIWLDKNCPTVQKMKEPITNEQAEDLVIKYTKELIAETFTAMENKLTLLKDYKSANLTVRNWIKRAEKDKQTEPKNLNYKEI